MEMIENVACCHISVVYTLIQIGFLAKHIECTKL